MNAGANATMRAEINAPLRTLDFRDGHPNLLVMLPGAYMRPEDFVDAGFVTALKHSGQPLDLCLPDLDLASISAGTILPAVQQQLLEPARKKYQRVWLGGISLGGLLALCQATDHPATVDGLCLLAPYPGSRLTQNAITRAGGLKHWHISPEQRTDPEFRVWQWLKSPPADLPVFVGYGTEDRFAEGMQQLAAQFPPAARHPVAGNHGWPAWQLLWQHFLYPSLELHYFH